MKGGPQNLQGKSFSRAKSQKKPSKSSQQKQARKEPEPPSAQEIEASKASLRERYKRDERIRVDGKERTIKEVLDSGDEELKAKLAKNLKAKPDEIANAQENGTLDELISKYADKAADERVSRIKSNMKIYGQDFASFFTTVQKEKSDSAIKELGEDCISLLEYDSLAHKNLSISTPDDISLQQAYINGGYGIKAETLNAKLYNNTGTLTQTERDFIDMVDRTSIAFERDVSVFRSTGVDYLERIVGANSTEPDFYSKLDSKIGTVVTHEAVTSTAVGVPSFFNRKENIVCRIKAPAGTRGCTLQNFSEGEILLPANTKLKLSGYSVGGNYGTWNATNTSARSQTLGVVHSDNKLILEMEVVDDE